MSYENDALVNSVAWYAVVVPRGVVHAIYSTAHHLQLLYFKQNRSITNSSSGSYTGFDTAVKIKYDTSIDMNILRTYLDFVCLGIGLINHTQVRHRVHAKGAACVWQWQHCCIDCSSGSTVVNELTYLLSLLLACCCHSSSNSSTEIETPFGR